MTLSNKAYDTAPRVPACAPPKGFRKRPGLKVKLQALLLHGPVLDENGNQITDLNLITWDHCPPLMQREYNQSRKDTIPAANDPAFIIPRAIAVHQEKTAKTDIPEIAKTKRLSDEQIEFRGRILSKIADDLKTHRNQPQKRKIPSRRFPPTKKQQQRAAQRKGDLDDKFCV